MNNEELKKRLEEEQQRRLREELERKQRDDQARRERDLLESQREKLRKGGPTDQRPDEDD